VRKGVVGQGLEEKKTPPNKRTGSGEKSKGKNQRGKIKGKEKSKTAMCELEKYSTTYGGRPAQKAVFCKHQGPAVGAHDQPLSFG
jgi:hypothetical protein